MILCVDINNCSVEVLSLDDYNEGSFQFLDSFNNQLLVSYSTPTKFPQILSISYPNKTIKLLEMQDENPGK